MNYISQIEYNKDGYKKPVGYHVMRKDGTILKEVKYRDRPYSKVKQHVNSNGYARVSLTFSGVTKQYYVHKVVAQCFLPDWTPCCQIIHKNGNKLDNGVDNLMVRYPGGLRKDDITLIKNAKGISQRELSRIYNVSKSTIQRIQKGR